MRDASQCGHRVLLKTRPLALLGCRSGLLARVGPSTDPPALGAAPLSTANAFSPFFMNLYLCPHLIIKLRGGLTETEELCRR